MLCFPNCKINIGLSVTRKREDGYHDIETVFYPVIAEGAAGQGPDMQLHDALEVVEAPDTSLHMSGLAVQGKDHENLVLKAYNLLKERYSTIVSGLDIYLHKAIPMGAGLGGGSANGAFMLRLLNDYFKLNLNNTELADLALRLGSDCPFFIYNTPQFASGRGEKMRSISIDLTNYSLQIICPEVHVSTAKAFAMIQPKPASFDLRKLHELPVSAWKDYIVNDFEAPVFAMHPELAEIKQAMYNLGAVYASMSGSGSAIYGLFVKGRSAAIQSAIPFRDFYLQ